MGIRSVLVLTPSLKDVGGIQSYTRQLVDALSEILGKDSVRTVAISAEPKLASDGRVALGPFAKLRFGVAASAAAILWRPDLVICTHIGVAPVARLIEKVTRIPYWLTLHGIEVWGDLSPVKSRALRGAQRYLVLTRFTLDATVARHALGETAHSILPLPLGDTRQLSHAADHFGRGDVGRPGSRAHRGTPCGCRAIQGRP